MQFHILAIGRGRSHPADQLARTYLERLPWSVQFKEFEERRKLSAAELQLREGALLLKAVPVGAYVVALDSGGRVLSSSEFAQRIADKIHSGPSDYCFLIGGANGFSPPVRERADFILSLGAMTWPHMLARLLLCEQLYRAHTILAGHPYHRE